MFASIINKKYFAAKNILPTHLLQNSIKRNSLIVVNAVIADPVVLDAKDLTGALVSQEKIQLNVAKEASSGHIVHRYLSMYLQNRRQGSANTKTRSEVRGGGKKPYTQKKTGNARRGSNRSPLRPGGGVLFGPKPRCWATSMTKKERRLAMATTLQNSADIMTVVDVFETEDSKSRTIVRTLQQLGADPMREKVVVIVKNPDPRVIIGIRNVKMATLLNLHNINVFDILTANKIIVDKHALTHITEFYGPPQISNVQSQK